MSATISDAASLSTDYWNDSIFKELITLPNDLRGRWGEDFVYRLLLKSSVDCSWLADNNCNQNDGTYDIQTSNGTRIEVKTAASANNWQHENIYAAPVWDYVVFLDVEHSYITITFISHKDLLPCLNPSGVRHPIFGRKGTLRGSQDDKYKYDFGPKQHQLGLANGYSFTYDVNAPDDEGLVEYIQNLNL